MQNIIQVPSPPGMRHVGSSLPAEIAGSSSNAPDPGPHYFWSPGVAVHRVEAHDGCPHIEVCTVTPVRDYGIWRTLELSSPAAVRRREIRDHSSNKMVEERLNVEDSGSIARRILEESGGCGVIKIETFAGLSEAFLQLDLLNTLLYPRKAEWEFLRESYVEHVDDSLAAAIETEGALAVRHSMVREARRQINTHEFATRHSTDLRAVYLAGLAEIEASFGAFKSWTMRVLKESDDQIRKHRNGGVGKPSYDARDEHLIWLTKHKRADDVSTTQAITVNTPPAQQVDVAGIVSAVTQAVLAAQVVTSNPASPSVASVPAPATDLGELPSASSKPRK